MTLTFLAEQDHGIARWWIYRSTGTRRPFLIVSYSREVNETAYWFSDTPGQSSDSGQTSPVRTLAVGHLPPARALAAVRHAEAYEAPLA